MSLASARVKLQESLREARIGWLAVRQQWDDPAAKAIEHDAIDPLEERIRAAVAAIERMETFTHAVMRETRDEPH